MTNGRGRPRKYVTEESFGKFQKENDARWTKFLGNDFSHLKDKVYLNSKLLWIILAALIGLFIAERFFS